MNKDNIIKFSYYDGGNGIDDFLFCRMPKVMLYGNEFEHISDSAKLLYLIMFDRTCLSIKNNWVDNENHVFIYLTQVEAMKILKCGNSKIFGLFKELDENGLIIRKKQGLNKPDIIYLNDITKQEFVDNSYNGEYKYARPNFKTSTDTKSDEINFLQNQISELQKQVDRLSNDTNVENSNFEKQNAVVMKNNIEFSTFQEKTQPQTIEINNKDLLKSKSPDPCKTKANNTNINNNNFNNNNSINLSSCDVENSNFENYENYENERLNENNILKIENILLPIETLKNSDQTKTVILNLIDKNRVVGSDSHKNTLDLFINSLTSLLTSKKFSSNRFEVYNKIFNLKNTDRILITDLALRSIEDFLNGSSHSNIVYPTNYMCSCILNVLDYGNIKETISNYKNSNCNPSSNHYSSSNKSFNVAEVEEMWRNIVPRLI